MLYPLANGRDDKGKRAVMDAAGPAAIVAAMKQHVAIAELKCGGCDALGAVAYGDATWPWCMYCRRSWRQPPAQVANARFKRDSLSS